MAKNDAAVKVLSQALKLEQEGRAFYLKAAEATASDKGRAMFLSLADDEQKHADMVLRQLHTLEGGGQYVLLPNLKVPAIDLKDKLFPPEKRAIDKKLGVNPGELDALHVALENEVKSYELYRAATREATDKAGQQMYQWLAAAEMTHFNLLMLNYEALVSSGNWA